MPVETVKRATNFDPDSFLSSFVRDAYFVIDGLGLWAKDTRDSKKTSDTISITESENLNFELKSDESDETHCRNFYSRPGELKLWLLIMKSIPHLIKLSNTNSETGLGSTASSAVTHDSNSPNLDSHSAESITKTNSANNNNNYDTPTKSN